MLFQEVARHIPMINFALPHSTSEDVQVGDYFFPEGTQVPLSLKSYIAIGKIHSYFVLSKVLQVASVINKCPKTFAPDPEAFRPERFITEDGKIQVYVDFDLG